MRGTGAAGCRDAATELTVSTSPPAAEPVQVMAAALGVPTTQHTYEDIQLTLEALKADYPVAASVVEFNEVRAPT